VKLLLDTHSLLWTMTDDPRLSPPARALVADPANDVLVSAASLWEIVIKVRIGKLEADFDEIDRAIDAQGFARLGIEPSHLAALQRLETLHRDPFDHLLIAQAEVEEASLLTDDREILRYPVATVRCSAD
jgi:PIN domain nuclease of toxin-antitoxin system